MMTESQRPNSIPSPLTMSFAAGARSFIAASMIAALMLLHSAPAQAQRGDEVVRPWNCLTYSLPESFPPGTTPFARQAPPAGCAVPSTPLPVGVRAIVPPGVPTGLTASANGRAVVLKWTPGAGAVQSYLVYAGNSSGLVNLAKFDTESSLPTLTVTDVPDGTFFFRVFAQTSSGVSAASNEASVRVGSLRLTKECAYATPPPSTALTVIYLSPTQIQLIWRAGEEGDCQAVNPVTRGYQLEVGSTPGSETPFLFLGTLGGRTTYTTDTGGAAGVFYVWIRGCGTAGCGGPSNEVIINLGPATAPPSAPSNVLGTGFGSTFVLTWDETSPVSSRPTSYTITVNPLINGSGTLGVGAPITQGGKTIGLYRTTAIPKGTYTFQIMANNGTLRSGLSQPVTVILDGPGSPVSVGGLHAFSDTANDGANLSNVIAGNTGIEVLGTASSGGPRNSRCVQDRDGCGIVFRTVIDSTSPTLTPIALFGTSAAPTSGNPPMYPRGAPLLARDGSIWGTTVGQEFTNPNGGGAAVVYKLTGSGNSYSTQIVAELGGPSYSKLMQATDGSIWGTTLTNGPGPCAYRLIPTCNPSSGSGTLFKIVASTLTYMHTFNGPDGASPYGGVILGADGKLYGMTSKGGAFGLGVIYRFDPNTNTFTTLYSFPGATGGAGPLGELTQIGNTFYGVTECGGDQTNTAVYCLGVDGNGTAAGKGTIFSMTVSGDTANVTILHRFTGKIQETGQDQLTQAYDGLLPTANLTVGPDGRLYGVTNGGGAFGAGTAFSILTNGGGYEQLYTFGGGAEGGGLNSTLVFLPTYAAFIGTGQYGGGLNFGAIYYMTLPSGY